MDDYPPVLLNRFMRCVARYLEARRRVLFATTPTDRAMAGALVAYWQKEAERANH